LLLLLQATSPLAGGSIAARGRRAADDHQRSTFRHTEKSGSVYERNLSGR
jgi:hypothetical protein